MKFLSCVYHEKFPCHATIYVCVCFSVKIMLFPKSQSKIDTPESCVSFILPYTPRDRQFEKHRTRHPSA